MQMRSDNETYYNGELKPATMMLKRLRTALSPGHSGQTVGSVAPTDQADTPIASVRP
jgi:hypothetical protein